MTWSLGWWEARTARPTETRKTEMTTRLPSSAWASERAGETPHTQTHLHMCVRMHTCSHGLALTLLRPPVPLHISSTHFLLHKVAPPTHHTQELAATNTAILYRGQGGDPPCLKIFTLGLRAPTSDRVRQILSSFSPLPQLTNPQRQQGQDLSFPFACVEGSIIGLAIKMCSGD